MKKTLLLLATAFACFACNQVDEGMDSANGNDAKITFKSNIAPTRVYNDLFENGDAISVTASSLNGDIVAEDIIYSYDGAIFSSADPIMQEPNGQYIYTAAYPAVDFIDGGAIFAMADYQNSLKTYSYSDLLVAQHEATAESCPTLSFKHAMSSLVINITDKAMAGGNMTIYAKNNAIVNIGANVYDPFDEIAAITPYSTDSLTYKAIVAPQTFTTGNLMATYEVNGTTYTWEIVNSINFQSGRRYTYNWNIVNGDVSYEGEIDGWYDVEITDQNENVSFVYVDPESNNFFEVSDEDKTFSIPFTRINSTEAGAYEFELITEQEGYIALDTNVVEFAEGDTEAIITGRLLDAAPQGARANLTTHLFEESAFKCTISILNEGCQYPTFFDFTVSYPFTWESVIGDNGDHTATWNDGIVMSVFQFGSAPKEVIVHKAKEYHTIENNWELYRFTEVYTPQYLADLHNAGDMESEATADDLIGLAKHDYEDGEFMYNYLILDKTTGKAFFPYQTTGFVMHEEEYGYMNFASYCDINFAFDAEDEAKSIYGTYEDGVITFPINSIWIQLTKFNETGAAWLNETSTHTINMPGVVLSR